MTTALQTLEARGLDVELADRMGIGSSRLAGGDVVQIDFRRGEEVIRRKFKRLVEVEGKPRYWQEPKGGAKLAWNEDAVRDDALLGQPLIITEGELDALSAIQCGFLRTISVPDGAPPPGQRSAEDLEGASKYDWLREIKPFLSRERAPEIIIAADGDENGAALLQDLSVMLGRFRCKFVTYPKARDPQARGRDRLKDLNEVLQDYGVKGVVETINRAQWIKVDGVHRMSELPPLPKSIIYEPRPSQFGLFREHFKPRMGDFSVITGTPGFGKALALDTPIPTPFGWTTMGEVAVGDVLFDEDGKPCTVTFATEVQHNRPCYLVRFDDGTEIVADADHRWLTTSEKARRSALEAKRGRGDREGVLPRGSDQRRKRTFASVVTTAEIAGSLRAMGKTNHQVELAKPFVGTPADLPIDAYVLGVWLGDGSSQAAIVHCGDQDHDEMVAAISATAQPVKSVRRKSVWTIALTEGRGGERKSKTQTKLREMGVFGNKHIPVEYLRAPEADRLALLQGLMDTDGYISPSGHCEFCSTNENLARGVLDLALGLGVKAKMLVGRATIGGRDCGVKYRVVWASTLQAFRLKRKAARVPASTPRALSRRIVACEPIESVPVRCIQVDSPSHLFLCSRSYIPTHNTTFANDLFCGIAQDNNLTIAWASFEQEPQRDHRRNLRTWFCQQPEHTLDEGQRAAADRWIDANHVFLVPNEDDDADLEWLLDKMEAAVVRFGASIIIIDPWNELEHSRRGNETETEYTGRAIRALKRFAKAFRVHVCVIAHPTKSVKDGDGNYKMPTLYDIAGSANWYNKSDLGVIVHKDRLEYRDEPYTLVKVQKSRYHEVIGRPGEVYMDFCKDTRRFTDVERGAQ